MRLCTSFLLRQGLLEWDSVKFLFNGINTLVFGTCIFQPKKSPFLDSVGTNIRAKIDSPSVRHYWTDSDCGWRPSPRTFSESLAPDWLQVSRRLSLRRTAQTIVCFIAAPTSQHFVTLFSCPQRGRLLALASPTQLRVTFDVRPPI